MKAIVLREKYSIDGLVLADHPDPQMGPGKVMVRIEACSLNYRDLLIVRGYGRWRKPLPLVPLSDAAGVVVEIAQGVSRVAVGDRIAATFVPTWLEGDLTEENDGPAIGEMLVQYRVLPEEVLVRVPGHLSDVEAATLPCAAVTAWNALNGEGGPKTGDTVVVLGSGGVSLFALQFALLMGAHVIAISPSEAKHERLRALGAQHVIDPKLTASWSEVVRELTAGRGADYVVDVVGKLADSVRAVRLGGTIGVIGMLDGFLTQINPAAIMEKNARLRGLQVGSREMFDTMNRALSLQRIHPVIDHVYSLADARDAYRRLEDRDHFGKICIRLWDNVRKADSASAGS
ncbi:NAD(P)-dependent alcohol dehydrogenase [bacterium]|nr:NAD(P)-dependent alcohol dehydrogenase [bacterium]